MRQVQHDLTRDIEALGMRLKFINIVLVPLLIMALGFKLYYFMVLLMRSRIEVLERERGSAWVREVVHTS